MRTLQVMSKEVILNTRQESKRRKPQDHQTTILRLRLNDYETFRNRRELRCRVSC
ncbi:MAG: hypothetical protein JWP89_176 [Schlesneria sp.]|nr:hypothetical protein [Schlesneria sp.]